MNHAAESPQPASEFSELAPKDLLDELSRREDRAPLELVDACTAQGDAMVDALRDLIDDELAWNPYEEGEWWLLLHAAFILGRMPSEAAGLLLAHLMRSMDERDDVDLQDRLAGEWPALFSNKPRRAIDAVRELVMDTSHDWYIRCEGIGVVLDAQMREGSAALDAALDWAATLATDESAEWIFRTLVASMLLDFPRARHRALLETIAGDGAQRHVEEPVDAATFTLEDVAEAFSRNTDEPEWRDRDDPWKFYSPDAIAERQQRWQAEGENTEAFGPYWDAPPPYIRTTPKVGRNEPCPCGSGKKYKRCCLARDEATTREILEPSQY